MSELCQLKKHGRKPEELRFYALSWSLGTLTLLGPDDLIDDFGALRPKLARIGNSSSDKGEDEEQKQEDDSVRRPPLGQHGRFKVLLFT